MKLQVHIAKLGMASALVLGATAVHASLSTSYVFNGNGNWSLDGCGSNSTPVCTVSAVVPTGSTIEAAFLYSSLYNLSGPVAVPTVTFEGITYSGADWTSLGSYNPDATVPSFTLGAYRTDVTAQIAAAVGGGSDFAFNFTVDSENPNGNIDGEVLAIIYSNPAEQERTIAFLDGFSTSGGDTTTLNLADPLSAAQLADADFEAMLSLGIGFGFQPSDQFSTVDVNGVNLTTCAGGQDDGGGFNGGLITVGGLGDSTDAPTCTASNNVRDDDELYSLVPFLSEGDTTISIETENPSLNDNIFFAGVNITAVAGVDDDPPSSVPEPGSLALLGLGLLGVAFSRRKKAA